MNTPALTLVGDLSLLVAALVTTALVIVYGVGSQFEETEIGRQFMLTKACLALILDFAAFNMFLRFSEPLNLTTGSLVGRIVIYLIVAVVMLRWLIKIVTIQSQERRKDRSGKIW